MTTAAGKDQWQYNAKSFSWKAELKRTQGSRTADLFLEPGHVVAAQNYHILIRYDNGGTHELDIRSRPANRGLRMPGAALQARWLGQEKLDRVGSGPSVGPDGVADVRIRLSAVSAKIPPKALRIEAPGGLKWESGPNPDLLPGAEYWADPKKPGEGDLFFQPERDLKGQKLKVLVLYSNDTLDTATVVAGRCDPKLRIPVCALAADQRAGRDLPLDRPGRSGRDRQRRCSRPPHGNGPDAGARRCRADRFGARHLGLPRQ